MRVSRTRHSPVSAGPGWLQGPLSSPSSGWGAQPGSHPPPSPALLPTPEWFYGLLWSLSRCWLHFVLPGDWWVLCSGWLGKFWVGRGLGLVLEGFTTSRDESPEGVQPASQAPLEASAGLRRSSLFCVRGGAELGTDRTRCLWSRALPSAPGASGAWPCPLRSGLSLLISAFGAEPGDVRSLLMSALE